MPCLSKQFQKIIMSYEFEYDGELVNWLKNFHEFDLFEKLGEILRPEQELEFEDEINF